jgi:hypothetical protein
MVVVFIIDVICFELIGVVFPFHGNPREMDGMENGIVPE